MELKNPALIRKAFVNMLEDMYREKKIAEVSRDQTRRALINMLEDLKKSNDILEEKNRELKEALQQLKDTTDKLIQTEKIRALGEAITSLAHDIKNILNGLEGGMFIMNQGVQKENIQSIIKGWRMVKKNIERIKDLSMDMVLYAKSRKPEYRLSDLNHIIQEVVELLEDKARERNVTLRWEREPLLEPVQIDPKGIYRCLLNLVTNAIDACSAAGSEVVIEVCTLEDSKLQIKVSDTGEGMPQDRIKNIFTPFHSTKGYKGTGLGLAVANKVVAEHNGSITVDSEVGRGTIFIITLPYTE